MNLSNNMLKSDKAVLFFGALVPDTAEFAIHGFCRSGNLAQMGIVEGVYHAGVHVEILSGQPVAAFPGSKVLFCPRKVRGLESGLRIVTIPSPNILFVREFFRGVYALFAAVGWAFRNRNATRYIMTYNLYTPPILFGFLAARLTGSKLVPVLFDMGMPPGDLGRLRMTIYRCVEWIARKMVPRFDGRIVITDRIAEDYAKGRHALVVDGGITESVSSRLFPLSRAAGGEMEKFRMLCAGTLWPGNGVELLLEAMTLIPDQDIELWFAGPDGSSLDAIKRRQKADKRIVYKGLLDHAALFKLYEDADLLLNVRITRSMNTDYLFPSKMLEYLAVGKPVLSTAVAHVEKDYGDYCYVVKEETAAALAAKIVSVKWIPASERYGLGCRAREFMLKNRTWNAQGKRICAYLEGPCLDR